MFGSKEKVGGGLVQHEFHNPIGKTYVITHNVTPAFPKCRDILLIGAITLYNEMCIGRVSFAR